MRDKSDDCASNFLYIIFQSNNCQEEKLTKKQANYLIELCNLLLFVVKLEVITATQILILTISDYLIQVYLKKIVTTKQPQEIVPKTMLTKLMVASLASPSPNMIAKFVK